MFRVEIDYIYNLDRLIKEINCQNIEDIVFTKDGEVVDISKDTLKEWKYIGLNNMDFILSDFYNKGSM